jgi:hypothetical protein
MQVSTISARVMVKPDGLARALTDREAAKITATWNNLLDALADMSTDRAPEAGLVNELPGIIDGRRSYRRGYDLQTWRAQARSCPRLATGQAAPISVHYLHTAIFNSLGLSCYEYFHGTLTVAEVESMYRPSQWFAEDPEALITYMRSGPVIREKWQGDAVEIALLVKFAIRFALNIEGRYNLVHCDLIPTSDAPF